jgi:alcohol dehydrogenase (cytochrome c)
MKTRSKKGIAWSVAALILCGVAAGAYVFTHMSQTLPTLALAINYLRFLGAPDGTITTEVNPSELAAAVPLRDAATPTVLEDDWPHYNKTLTSNRFSPLGQINAGNAGKLKVLCTYDTGVHTAFSTGLIEVNGALIGTTGYDIFSIDPSTCRQNWRTHENYVPAAPMLANRGAAYLDGRLFRGTQDARVLAYDFKTGKRLWATSIGNPKIGESAPAAPIAWNGLVFIGQAGGDSKGVKGRMYALDAQTGKIVWEFYLVPRTAGDVIRGPQGASPLDTSSWQTPPGQPISGGATWTSYTLDPATGLLYVPGGNPAPDFAPDLRKGENLYSGSLVVLDARTGAYQDHIKVVPLDWHDWDVSSAPALIQTASGKKIISLAPKDGHLYGFDLATKTMLYRTPVTRIENAEEKFSTTKSVHFCPGSGGGAEWNGPAYDPETNFVYIGEVDWCNTVKVQTPKQLADAPIGAPWGGMATINPFNLWGAQDTFHKWAGWVYAVDADTGAWRWRVRTNYPIQSGMTPTAGGVVFFGNTGGYFYVLDAATGQKLWGQSIGGAIGGGVITYTVNGRQKVAVAHGLTSILWPTPIATAKVSILGL